MHTTDPTLEQMREYLDQETAGLVDQDDGYEFDREEAIYWFAANHAGQRSNLYAALCQSEYRPGPLTNGPENGYYYDVLVDAFGDA